VARLDVFGSALTHDWQPGSSDLDFLVMFGPDPRYSIADRYLGLAEGLEELFRCSVDLLTERSIRNPYFRRSVNSTRIPVYGE
jgi:predicted nucleotidyltransferase